MRIFRRLLKFNLVFLVMFVSALRPVIIYAHNSQNNSIFPVSISAARATHCVFSRNSTNLKTMGVLDKEKVDAVCLNPSVQKEMARLEPRFFQKITAVTAAPLSFQSLNLRI
jgi:hypothetical protein